MNKLINCRQFHYTEADKIEFTKVQAFEVLKKLEIENKEYYFRFADENVDIMEIPEVDGISKFWGGAGFVYEVTGPSFNLYLDCEEMELPEGFEASLLIVPFKRD